MTSSDYTLAERAVIAARTEDNLDPDARHLQRIADLDAAYAQFLPIFHSIGIVNERLALLGREWEVVKVKNDYALCDCQTGRVIYDLPSLGRWFLAITTPRS